MGFCIVSETLISATLSQIPKDRAVNETVRFYVSEHAKDEGRHHAFFADVLRAGWRCLAPSDRDFLAHLLPEFIRWFLEPDHGWLRAFLRGNGFAAAEVERVISESYPQDVVAGQIRADARQSLDRFHEAGVFRCSAAELSFSKAGLIK
jgi:hypothetical protein